MICLDIDPAYQVLSCELYVKLAITTWPATTEQTVLVNIPHNLYSMS